MIVTLTLNPSLDRTFVVDRLVRAELNRASQVTNDPAGKGVNVSKALHANNVDTLAVLPVGGTNGEELVRLLHLIGIACEAVPIEGAVRANVSIIEDDGTVTKINEPGPTLASTELDTLVSMALKQARPGDWLVASGNLPVGAPADIYRVVAKRAAAAGVKVALDSSGAALAAAITGRPTLIKPNLEELRELTSKRLGSLGEVIQAAHDLQSEGVERVLVSLGPYGAILTVGTQVIHGRVTVDNVRDTVGAGDALLAGYLAGGEDQATALRTGLAWARTALGTRGTTVAVSSPADYAAVTITETIDRSLSFDPELDHATR